MTVAELIEELMAIENKDLEVIITVDERTSYAYDVSMSWAWRPDKTQIDLVSIN
jgi:predicted heme/steroid binding protein